MATPSTLAHRDAEVVSILSSAPRVVDGMAHLTYYDPSSGLSFVWSGRLSEPIHVQPGGYGEPTAALIDPAPFYAAGDRSPVELLDWFRDLCDRWNANWDGVSIGGWVRTRG